MNNNFKTFKVMKNEGVLTVTFNNPPINVLGIPMMIDLNKLCDALECEKNIKVVIFESAIPNFFIAHADIDMLKNLPTKSIKKEDVVINDLALTLNRISLLPQVTIAKIEGYARGGGHEFALACDLRYAAKNKAVFMQMEVGMGILPCGGGSSRLARQVGLGKTLEIILSAKDFNAKQAEKFGTINKAIDEDKIGLYVYELANRISKFPIDAIKACKRTIYKSQDLSIAEALKEETYNLYLATSKTPAIKRFTVASETNFQNDLQNQKNFETLLMELQNIN